MKISTIYATYQGEINVFGIGAPVIFIRTSGCHLRCYKETLGILCDTPKELDGTVGTEMTTSEIVESVEKLSAEMGGIKLICLSGGDPLWRHPDQLHELFEAFRELRYIVSVETSGTINISEFSDYRHVSWVLDYKLKSAGVKPKFQTNCLPLLEAHDIIKFVVYDLADYEEFMSILSTLLQTTKAKIAVGVYWGSPEMNITTLIDLLKNDRVLGKVHINMQAHKLLTMYAETDKSHTSAINIPTEL